METEMSYLLEILESKDVKTPLTVGDLIGYINEAMVKQNQEQQRIDESYQPEW